MNIKIQHYLFIAVLAIIGCSGSGNLLIVASISGPEVMDEGSIATFSVEAHGDTGIEYVWGTSIAGAGIFEPQYGSTVEFTAAEVSADTELTIRVLVVSENDGPVIREWDLTILEVGDVQVDINVSEIEGPATLAEGQKGFFSVTASGDTGISYQWGVDPEHSGFFENPDENSTIFIPGEVQDNEEITISVSVTSDNAGPVLRTAQMEIRDVNPNQFVLTWGSHYTTNIDKATSVAVDGTGAAYTCGGFLRETDFDTGDGEDIRGTKLGMDIFLNRFSADGTYEWAITLEKLSDATFNNIANGIAVGRNNVYIVGEIETGLDVDPGVIVEEVHPHGQIDAFLASYTLDGEYNWAVSFGDYMQKARATDVVADPTFVYIVGDFMGEVDFDPGPDVYEVESRGNSDCFLLALDFLGNLVWVRTWGGERNDATYDIDMDDRGNLYITGSFQDSVNFGNDQEFSYLASNGYTDAYVTIWTTSGDFRWARSWGGEEEDFASGATSDNDGNIYVVGAFTETVDFDPGPDIFYYPSVNDTMDICTVKYSPDGDFEWVKRIGGSTVDGGIAIDYADGEIYIAGYTDNVVDIDPNPDDEYLVDATMEKRILVRLDEYGDFINGVAWGGDVLDIYVTPFGFTYACGRFTSYADFDPREGEIEHLFSNGAGDAFLMKFPPGFAWE